ncbi:FtsX-like permease family protein [Flagellimonas meishanensis]|uniref:FtsX-like permease family protein n=1 Tax=Flagellimonas meishanensis TaxID=2873264 RepID=UPI001CA664B6|nr:FtsX-like permease family protein [[Muricauda] meishanensis]
MIKNHLKIAWRNLKKQPFFTFLNVFGLAIGIAGGLLISIYIYDELSYDTVFADADRIHRINLDVKFGGTESQSAVTAAPMGPAMEQDFSQVELTTRFLEVGSLLIRKENDINNVKELKATYADSTFFKMFGLELLYGDTATALKDPNTLILTKAAAEKHFGIDNAVGQRVVLNDTDTYSVTGVIEDMPKNSFLREHSVFLAMSGTPEANEGNWGSHNFPTFIKFLPDTDVDAFQEPLQGMFGDYVIPYIQRYFPGITEEEFLASGNYFKFSTIPLTNIHLFSDRDSEMSANSSMQNIYILTFIAIFLIVLASVNFMNLSTAHSLRRAKEVGVRKTLGSDRSSLIRQFLVESGLITLLALVAGITMAMLSMSFFNSLAGKSLTIPFMNPWFWAILLGATILLGVLSGLYPAFFMSRFIPVKVLKGTGESAISDSKVRNLLVVFQFAVSVFLILGTLVVYQQLDFIQNKDLGYSKEQVLVVQDLSALGESAPFFKEQVRQLAKVKSVTLSSYLPTPSGRANTSFFQENAPSQEDAINMQAWQVDENYLSTLDMVLVAGRGFDPKITTDSTAVIVNESTVAILGVTPEEALGMRISHDIGESNPVYNPIIGVVKNFHFESLRKDIGALSLFLGTSADNMAVKLESGDFSKTISQIESIWKRIAPGQPFGFNFMDDAFDTTYKAEQNLGRVFMTFTILSIIIACLGLFGLAAFNAKKRTKEIGVRKVLGASVGQITYRLTMDFLKLVGVAILVSLPLGWFAMNKWLEDFSYRIAIDWQVFAVAAILAVGVAILTVSYQSIRAALTNPTKSLRME